MKHRHKTTGQIYDGKSVVVMREGKQVRIFNPSEEHLLEAGYEEYVAPGLTEEELLQRAKQDKLAEIDAYDASVSVFTIGGKDMWLDAATRKQLKVSLDACKAVGMTTAEKWFGGVKYEFPIDAWQQMLIAVEVYAAQVLNVTEQHKANVNAMSNIDDVTNYDYTVGYPQKLEL